jgi:hypothetical protein
MTSTPPELTVERLQRELAHVDRQFRVAHAMAMSWRQRALDAEEQCRRLQLLLQRREHAAHKSREHARGDGLHDTLEDLETDLNEESTPEQVS